MPQHVNLPDEVLARFDDPSALTVANRGRRPAEARGHGGVELRENGDGTVTVDGYATIYEHPYDIAGGAERGGWSEMIMRNAAAKSVSERDDVRLLFNHDGL